MNQQHFDDTTTTIPTARSASAGTRGRLVALAATFALTALATGTLLACSGGASTDTEPAAAVNEPTTTTALDELVAVASDDAAGGSSAPVQPERQPETQPETQPPPEVEPPVEPSVEPEAAPGVLAVSDGLIELPAQTWSGTFQVRNDGGSALDWQWAAGATGISVSHTAGTLQPGEFVEVDFAIDHTALPAGDFLFANCVYSADEAKDVRIEGTKTIKTNPQIELPAPVLAS